MRWLLLAFVMLVQLQGCSSAPKEPTHCIGTVYPNNMIVSMCFDTPITQDQVIQFQDLY